MKLKYYMRGLGIGVIGTTIVMTISNNIRGVASTTQDNQTATTGSIIAYTTEASTENTSKDATEVGSTTQESVATLTSSEESTENTQTVTEATTEATQAVTQAATQAQTAASNNGNKTVDVSIKNVYYSSLAADILYNAGVITDKDGFNTYMKSSGYATKIKEGVYSITPGESFENIAKIITKSK